MPDRPCIVSISRRSDVPAFFTPWLVKRLEEGYACYRNPFNPSQSLTVSLRPVHLAALVLWSRDYAPLLPHWQALCALNRPLLLHYTLNHYPAALEPGCPGLTHSLATLDALAFLLPPSALLWRYDPLVFTSLTPPAWHREHFALLCALMAGRVKRVYVSLMHPYRKSLRNLRNAAQVHGFSLIDPPFAEQVALLKDMQRTALAAGITLVTCSCPALTAAGLPQGACIDAQLLYDLGMDTRVCPSPAATRPGCACAYARDLGAYHTCPRGCAYCYAVEDPVKAVQNAAAVRPENPFLA